MSQCCSACLTLHATLLMKCVLRQCSREVTKARITVTKVKVVALSLAITEKRYVLLLSPENPGTVMLIC